MGGEGATVSAGWGDEGAIDEPRGQELRDQGQVSWTGSLMGWWTESHSSTNATKSRIYLRGLRWKDLVKTCLEEVSNSSWALRA